MQLQNKKEFSDPMGPLEVKSRVTRKTLLVLLIYIFTVGIALFALGGFWNV